MTNTDARLLFAARERGRLARGEWERGEMMTDRPPDELRIAMERWLRFLEVYDDNERVASDVTLLRANLDKITASSTMYAALISIRDALAAGAPDDSDLPERAYGTLETVLAAIARAQGVE